MDDLESKRTGNPLVNATLDQSSVANSESPAPTNAQFMETNLAQGIVGWDGQADPENPQNFSQARKWGLLSTISAITFISPLASSMVSPSVIFMKNDLGVSNDVVLSFSVTVFLLGYTVSSAHNLRAFCCYKKESLAKIQSL